MFESRLKLFERHLQLEGDLEWIPENGEGGVHLTRILFAYAWSPEQGGPSALKVAVSSSLADIDRLSREILPDSPPSAAWEDLLEEIHRDLDEFGYDAPGAILLNATDEVLEELAHRLRAIGYEDLQDAVDDEEVGNILFAFGHYEMEGLEVDPAAIPEEARE